MAKIVKNPQSIKVKTKNQNTRASQGFNGPSPSKRSVDVKEALKKQGKKGGTTLDSSSLDLMILE